MAGSGRYLFVTWPGGGNVQPVLGLAARLRARGHSVAALGSRSDALQRQFAAFGIPCRTAADDELLQPVLDEVRRAPPDVLVVDYMLPDALCAAERTGLPYGALVHTLYQQVAIGEPSPMEMAADLAEVNRMCASLALPPVERVTDLLERAQRVLVVAPPELDAPLGPAGVDGANVRYVGPLLEPAGVDAAWQPFGAPSEPLVVVSLGTTPMDEGPLVQRLLDALGALPVRVLANLGEHLDAGSFRVPPNAQLTGYVRHAAVLAHAALLVSHAGLGGVVAALAHGVPLVCLPLGRDQPANARAVAALGVGRVLAADVACVPLREAVADVLANGAYRSAARALASAWLARRGADLAVAELEAVLPS